MKENYLDLFDVNTFGAVRVSRTFLPLLRRTNNSRIVIITSTASRTTFPGITAYSMSKHAVRSFGDGLRREVARYGINVSIIEPAMYSTSINDTQFIINSARTNWTKTRAELKEELGQEEFKRFDHCIRYLNYMKRTDIQEVIDALLSSVISKSPRLYYKVSGYKDKIYLYLFSLLPVEIQDIYCEKVYFNSIIKLIQNQS